MSFVSGDMSEIVAVHPTLGTFRFEVKAGESATIDMGGIRTSDDANMVTGNGKNIKVMNAVRWSVEVAIAADLQSNYEESSLTALAAHPDDANWTFSHLSGMVRLGVGSPVGDINVDTNSGQLRLKVSGGGALQKIN